MPVRISKNRVALENIPLNLAQELDVASAATTNIGAALSNNLRITGTTAITAFDNVSPGIIRFLRFDSALTLTHNATTLILPGGANITTALGDSALAVSLGSGNWKVHFYQRQSGKAIFSRPTVQYLTSGSGATYTTPSGTSALRIRMVGGGGGGSAAATNAGGSGGNTTFSTITANGGTGGALSGVPYAGGAGGTGGAGSASLRIAGGGGPSAGGAASLTQGAGACSVFGGGAAGGGYNNAGGNAATNSGGGGTAGNNGGTYGSGGGAGEYAEFWITNPSATYTYTVGAAGAGGAAGTYAGGNGGSGLIIVEEY